MNGVAGWMAAGVVMLALTGASAANSLSCVAEYEQVCRGKTCRAEVHGAAAVRFTFDPTTASGNLCTYTYCRRFVLIRYRQAEPGAMRVSDLIVSAKAGSTKPASERPEVGMVLSVDLKKNRFGLTDGSATGMHGWFGSCRPARR